MGRPKAAPHKSATIERLRAECVKRGEPWNAWINYATAEDAADIIKQDAKERDGLVGMGDTVALHTIVLASILQAKNG